MEEKIKDKIKDLMMRYKDGCCNCTNCECEDRNIGYFIEELEEILK